MKQLILVDACNLVHRLPGYRESGDKGMDVLVERLLEEIRVLHDLENWELHLVVDGQGAVLDQQFQGNLKTLSILYSPHGVSADNIIEKWLLRLGRDWSVRVASEDRAVQRAAIASGAEILSAADLRDWAGRVRSRFTARQVAEDRKSSRSFGNRLDGLL